MPANTPIYGFTYPCPGDVVDPAAFALLANQVNTKLLDVQNDERLALNRWNTRFTSASTVATNNVNTATLGGNYVVQQSGLYAVDAWFLGAVVTATPITSIRLRILLNGTRVGGQTEKAVSGSADLNPLAVAVATAGQTFSTDLLYTGPAGTATYNIVMDVKMIARLA